ncbi:TRAP-type C4-dicarboxylate transport system permease small subunit [Algoriphagus aquaeductus]|jgi:TRAP-type C4-dicarboxylate transport system permease small subunit|uniref:TRAP-type C4-dicarboxylate transport system permease small subunit n=1 Tax=Algoriphagus aquaeductus TaxID=475299 RepID=A0A326RMJ6_9BACT|nr:MULTISPECIES: TRAP transporter small permease [Algoriphagus]PZV80267.1 TRAP-type C4-dicarboxylate transport system permease small subunit [Algoriphagus aquaeductus]
MKFKETLDKSISLLIAVLMGMMVLNVTWQVFSRYVMGDPSSFTDELSRYSMIWLGLAGAAYVSGKNGHLAIDILPEKLKGKKLLLLQLFIHSMVIFFGAVIMVWGGGNLVYITQILQQKSATLQIPLSWIYGIVPISGILVVYYHVFHIVQLFKNQE